VVSPVVVAFAAPSGTGKTTLIERVLRQLKADGLRVGAIKSDAHGVELDTPGKDTYRMRESGSETTALVSSNQLAIFFDAAEPETPPLAKLVEVFFSDLDIVLLEGFRRHGYPTIVVQRESRAPGDWRWPENVLAVATDGDARGAVPCFAIDDVKGIVALIRSLLDRERASGRKKSPPFA
jgi:molybdopterin-guanine dinucleotide biosynthesis protein MobB